MALTQFNGVCQVPGLYESTQPGVFTPAKFPKKIAQYLYPLHKRPDCT